MARDDPPAADALSLADRVELGLAHGYWEENLVEGRRAALARLVAAMAPLRGRRVLDPACGWGTTARTLGAEGAHVVACTPHPRRASRVQRMLTGAGAGEVVVVAAESLRVLRPGSFDDAVLVEPAILATEGPPREAWLDDLDVLDLERVFLVLRLPSRWSAVAGGADRERLPVFDVTALLREVHLATRYRLERSADEKRRNSALRIAVLGRARF
jgi:hypothetical protein